MRRNFLRSTGARAIPALICLGLTFSCSEDERLLNPENADSPATTSLVVTTTVTDCSTCKYIVPENINIINAAQLGILPGEKICLKTGVPYGKSPLRFINVVGEASNPIVITNCDGPATVTVPPNLTYVVWFQSSKYFRLTGGSTNGTYGINLSNAATLGISVDKLSTDFEIDHVEVHHVGFAGIMAKTDPNCDPATQRGNFTLRNARIHHNYVHDTGGEGLYVGNSFYSNGVSTTCGTVFPHDLENVKIYSNVVKNTGWEAIQLGAGTVGAEVYDNQIENYGTANVNGQNNGIQIGEGTGGLCYNNYIKTGLGNGIIVLGLGDNVVFNNIIINSGSNGIFCDDRTSPGPGFKFINNTIINPKGDGLRIYADKPWLINEVKNNLIGNPATFSIYETDTTPRTGPNDSYVYLLSTNVIVNQSNNFKTRNTQLANYLPFGNFSTGILTYCTIKNKGVNPSVWGVSFDIKMTGRPWAGGYDIGAVEY